MRFNFSAVANNYLVFWFTGRQSQVLDLCTYIDRKRKHQLGTWRETDTYQFQSVKPANNSAENDVSPVHRRQRSERN
jgi:hypothetical protein